MLAAVGKAQPGRPTSQVNGGYANVFLACLVGFALGGVAASTFGRAAQVPVALGALGGPLAASYAAVRDKDVIETAAIGCGIGILLGTILAFVDSFWV